MMGPSGVATVMINCLSHGTSTSSRRRRVGIIGNVYGSLRRLRVGDRNETAVTTDFPIGEDHWGS